MEPKSPILVTGMTRSGTTWVGRVLAASGEAFYVSEPLNAQHHPRVLSVRAPHRFPYISAGNNDQYAGAFHDLLELRYPFFRDLRGSRSVRSAASATRQWWRFAQARRRSARPLFKDPFAVFSSPWFAETLGCLVVITVRHPAAVVSSRLRLGWRFPFADLLAQQSLLSEYLEPYHSEITRHAEGDGDSLEGDALLWTLVYHAVQEQMRRFPDFRVVRHEDISRNPRAEICRPVYRARANAQSSRRRFRPGLKPWHATRG